MPRNRKSMPTTMPQTPRLARSITTKRKKAAVIESSVSPPPRRRISNRPLKDTDIYKHLVSENDDNCSNFDDDVGDPDFVLESNHNTESEQSDDDESQAVNYDVNEGRQEEISLDHEHEENTSEIEIEGSHDSNGQNEEQHSNKQVRQDKCNEEEAEYEQIRERNNNNQVSNPRYYYGKNRYKWSSVEPSRATRVRLHNIVNGPQQESPTEFQSFEELWKLFFTEGMIEKIVTYTNGKLITYRAKYKDTSKSELGATNETELKALIGLLFFTSVFCSNYENAEFIFATDGTGREIFRPSRLKRRTKYCCY